jgi:5'-nucleotidase
MKAAVLGRLLPLLLRLVLAPLPARAEAPPSASSRVARIKLLGFNDFHGQLGTGRELEGRPVGSAAVLGAYLRDATARFDGGTLIVHAGDFVGGSPHSSSLLQDEPAIAFLNLLGNEFCSGRSDARCNVVGTLGNHEFDEGAVELLRLLRGGPAKQGPFLEQPYRGARVPYVCANVLDTRGRPMLPAYVVQRVDGVRVAVIGAVLTATENIVLKEGLAGFRFVDESESINRAVRQLKRRGVEAIVVAIHQGAGMIPYAGPTRRDVSLPDSELAQIVGRLDTDVDVVISGHAHQFSNGFYQTHDGREILVTQAYSAGMAYADIELTIDRQSGEVIDKTAQIVPTYTDQGPGLSPAQDIAALAAAAEQRASALLAQVVGRAPEAVSEVPNRSGEVALGNLLADAQRASVDSDVAFVNQGAIRADLPAGPISLGRLLAIEPFGSVIVAMDLTGEQVRRVLEQQWAYDPPHILQVAGLSYRWDAALPVGKRVVSAYVGDAPLRDDARYRVSVSDYLGRGGGGFPTFAEGTRRVVGPRDVDALRAWITAAGGQARARIEGRILRRD